MTIEVRPAEQKDREQMNVLMYEYIVDFYKRQKPPVKKVDHIFDLLLQKEEGIQFVADSEGELLGFATLYFTYSTTKADRITVMNDLYVVEKARGEGVAQKLFKACEHYSKSNGYVHMSWVTATDNDRAKRFYEKMGGVRGDWINYTI